MRTPLFYTRESNNLEISPNVIPVYTETLRRYLSFTAADLCSDRVLSKRQEKEEKHVSLV